MLLGIAYAQSGSRIKALEQLNVASASMSDGEQLPYETAALYTALDDHAKALDMLDIAYEKRESDLVFINVDPLFASLRQEPRFQRMLTKMKLQ